MRYVYPIWGTPGDIAIQKREIDYVWYQIEGLDENIMEIPDFVILKKKKKKKHTKKTEIILLKWISFTPASTPPLNEVILTLTPIRAFGSTLKDSHDRYQLEGLEEIWNIIWLKWISFTPSLHSTLEWGHPEPEPHCDHEGSTLKGNHVWYQTEGLEEIWNIIYDSLGEKRANLSAFRTFVRFVLVWICRFPLPLGVWEGLRFVIVALPRLFYYLFFLNGSHSTPASTPPLNGVKKGPACEYSHISYQIEGLD